MSPTYASDDVPYCILALMGNYLVSIIDE